MNHSESRATPEVDEVLPETPRETPPTVSINGE